MSKALNDNKMVKLENPISMRLMDESESGTNTLSSVSAVHCAQNRDKIVSRLSCALADRFGITPNEQMAKKLHRIFSKMPSVEFHRRVIELTSLPSGHQSWLDLVARLTVHETYFFRDEPQLEMLQNVMLSHAIRKATRTSSPSIRILSAGCSTGEEVYSIAILALSALLEAGYAYGTKNTGVEIMPGWKLEVLGLDVSADALCIARKASYSEEGLGSFRNMDSQWLDWFDEFEVTSLQESEAGLYSQSYRQPKKFIRNVTDFHQHNLLQSSAHFGLFDLVICRNTMIYFNDANKRTAQNYLFDRLKSDGVLLLGATDPLLCPERCEQRRSNGMAYCTKKQPSLSQAN